MYLQNISRLNGTSNLGGILEIQVARKADVVSIPSPVFNVITGDITFSAGTGFRTWRVTQESPNIKSTSRQSREGTSKSNRLPFRLPLDVSSIRNMLEQAEEDEFIVLFKYPNGKRKIFGTLDRPVRFSFDHDSGSGYADGNFNNCEFYYDGPQNIYFYSGTVTDAPVGGGTSQIQFLFSPGATILLSPSDEHIFSSAFEHTFTLVPGPGGAAAPAIVKWDTGELIASMQPGDVLLVDSAFTEDIETVSTS